MKFSLFRKYGALNSTELFDAFSKSIKRKGWQVVDNDDRADVAVIWSVLWHGRMQANKLIWEKYQKHNRPVIVLEVGALDRGKLWKVAINGINGTGYFGPNNNNSSRRKKLNINLKPWKQGSNIVLCGQHPSSQQWQNMPPMHMWMSETINLIRKYSDRKIIVRPHPRANYVPIGQIKNVEIKPPCHMIGTYDSFDFEETLDNAWAVVNWNSNPATVSALHGVPVFVGPDSLSASIGNLDLKYIESPAMPERDQWANDLAYTEWTVDEIANGEPLERISDRLLNYST
jgi:hypothetical protein